MENGIENGIENSDFAQPQTLEGLMRAQIATQKATTHAVRALVILCLGYLPWALVGSLLLFIGSRMVTSSDSGGYDVDWNAYHAGQGMQAFGAIFLVVGVIITLIWAWREFLKSRV